MSGSPNDDRHGGRQAARRQATIDEIVAAAWELVRERGLAGLTLRDLGKRVGMRAQSLYSYFASKHEIYDAMFLQGNEAFLASTRVILAEAAGDDPVAQAHRGARHFFDFCVSDPARHQLLFQRTIPDFEPSARSYAVAQEAYDLGTAPLRAMGIDQAGIDLWTAMLSGLVSQQLSNDPGGTRWQRLVDDAVDVLLGALAPDLLDPATTSERSAR